MSKYLSIILLAALGLTACSEQAILDVFEEFTDDNWSYNEPVLSSFTIEDTTVYYQWFTNLRVSSDYEYSNIQMKLFLSAPDQSIHEEVIDLTLAEKSGKWLGSGMGDVITYQVPISNKKVFKQTGEYHVRLEQHTRFETLEHVRAAGMKLVKQEEIF